MINYHDFVILHNTLGECISNVFASYLSKKQSSCLDDNICRFFQAISKRFYRWFKKKTWKIINPFTIIFTGMGDDRLSYQNLGQSYISRWTKCPKQNVCLALDAEVQHTGSNIDCLTGDQKKKSPCQSETSVPSIKPLLVGSYQTASSSGDARPWPFFSRATSSVHCLADICLLTNCGLTSGEVFEKILSVHEEGRCLRISVRR